MKKVLAIALWIIAFYNVNSQELLCRVNINYQTLNVSNQQIFTSMYKDINEFLNQTQWTNYVFGQNERIECSMVLNLTSFNGVDQFEGTLQVSLNRPVYDASMVTSVFNIQESSSFKFNYIENSPLEFNENTFTGELAYALAFYAYIIIGYDFDTFSELGGSEFFQKAQKIVQNAQSSRQNDGVWRAQGSRNENNRYWLVNFLNSDVFSDFRIAMYKYHRLGLDVMTNDIMSGRNSVVEALDLIKKVNQSKPNNYIVYIFLESKRAEITNIFSEAPLPEITRIKPVLKLIDPTHSAEYERIGTKQ